MIFCSVLTLQAMDEGPVENGKKYDLQQALKLAQGNRFVVYWDSTEMPTEAGSKKAVEIFREKASKNPNEFVIDYVVNGKKLFEVWDYTGPRRWDEHDAWKDGKSDVSFIVKYASDKTFNEPESTLTYGMVLYNIFSSDGIELAQHIDNVQQLKNVGMSIIVHADTEQIARNIFDKSSIGFLQKSLLINKQLVSKEQSYKLSNFLLLSGLCLVGFFLYKKYFSSQG